MTKTTQQKSKQICVVNNGTNDKVVKNLKQNRKKMKMKS